MREQCGQDVLRVVPQQGQREPCLLPRQLQIIQIRASPARRKRREAFCPFYPNANPMHLRDEKVLTLARQKIVCTAHAIPVRAVQA